MSQHTLSAEKLQEIQELACGWGKIVARRVLGEPGQGTAIDLMAMEQVAAAAARGLTEGTLTALLEHQANTRAAEQPCPDCGRLCPVAFADRPLTVHGSHQLNLHEPIGHCPDCCRDFFPRRLCLRLDNHHDSLQLRAALLSEDDRLERFFAQRPGNPYRRRQAA
jgi:hypothetical protein